MKILAISDNVIPMLENTSHLHKQYADVSLVVSCGDLPGPYLDLVATTLNAPLFFVRGNHDLLYEPGNPGGEDLHQRIAKFQKMVFAGLEGSPRYNREPVQYEEYQMLAMVLGFAPRLLLRRLRFGHGLDVLVTHAPPRDIHDRSDKPHRGFRSLRLFMQLYRPRYLLHGHVDTWDSRQIRETQFLQTKVININPSKVVEI